MGPLPALELLKKGLIEFPPIDLYQLKDYEKALVPRPLRLVLYFNLIYIGVYQYIKILSKTNNI